MKGNVMKWLKRASVALLPAAAILFTAGLSTPADAHDGWRRGHHRHWHGPRVVVRPAPVYVAPRYYYPPPAYYAPPPPPVYYAPPPVYYAPPPVYYAPRYPSAHLSIGIPLR